MDTELFRQNALAARQQQWFAPVTIVTPVSATTLMVAALIVILLLCLAVSAIEVPDKIRVSGILVPQDNLVEIRAPRSGRVRQLRAETGSVVNNGQALLVIDNATSAPDQDALAAEQINSLQREIELLDDALHQDLATIERRLDAGQGRLAGLRSRLQLANDELRMQERIVAIQAAAAQRIESLASVSTASRQQADDYRMAAIRTQAEEQQLAREVLRLEADLDLLGRQLSDEKATAEQVRTRAAIRREVLQREIARHRAGASAEITATVSGQVAGVSVSEGGYVSAGELLLTLHKPASPLEVRLYVPASQAGRIKPGQEVRLKLGAFPEQLYGVQTAEVTDVSPVALPAGDLAARLSLRGLVFEVRAVTKGVDSLAARLPPGTVVHADVVRHRWPLLKWLFSSRRGVAA